MGQIVKYVIAVTERISFVQLLEDEWINGKLYF